jgi:hypothetical protein
MHDVVAERTNKGKEGLSARVVRAGIAFSDRVCTPFLPNRGVVAEGGTCLRRCPLDAHDRRSH